MLQYSWYFVITNKRKEGTKDDIFTCSSFEG